MFTRQPAIIICSSALSLITLTANAQEPINQSTAQTEIPVELRLSKGQAQSITNDEIFTGWVYGPLIEVYKGPGGGYPIIDTLEHGDKITIHRLKTQWLQISTYRLDKAWIAKDQLPKIIDKNGYPLYLPPTNQRFKAGDIEVSVLAGQIDGTEYITGGLGYYFSPQLSLEASLSHNFEGLLAGRITNVQLTQEFANFKQWRPYALIGVGTFNSDQTNLETSDFDILKAGIGFRKPLFEQLFLRFEYSSQVILTSTQTNFHADTFGLGISTVF